MRGDEGTPPVKQLIVGQGRTEMLGCMAHCAGTLKGCALCVCPAKPSFRIGFCGRMFIWQRRRLKAVLCYVMRIGIWIFMPTLSHSSPI